MDQKKLRIWTLFTQYMNHKYYWPPILYFLLSSIMLMLCSMLLTPSYLERGCISIALTERKHFAGNLVIKLIQNHSDTLKFKFRSTCGLKKFRFLSSVEHISIVENECPTLLSFLDNFCFYLFIHLYTSSCFFYFKTTYFCKKKTTWTMSVISETSNETYHKSSNARQWSSKRFYLFFYLISILS